MEDHHIRQAVILAGGRGSRLREMTRNTPKPLLPVNGRPFMDYLLDAVAAAGMQRIILSCGYLAEQFQQRYGNKKWRSATVECIPEASPAGTGGALALLQNRLDRRFFLLNGDSIAAVDFDHLARALAEHSADREGVLALTPHPEGATRYDRIGLDDTGCILSFGGDSTGHFINAGIYALNRSVAALCPVPSSLEKDVLAALAAQGRLGGVRCREGFIDIGVPEDFARAQLEVPRIAATIGTR